MILHLLRYVGNNFLYKNNSIEVLELPGLVKTGRYFMYENNSLKVLLVPKLEKVDFGFLFDNKVLEYIYYDVEQLKGYVNWFDTSTKRKILKI